jgi:fibro-slime domain-containing protein
MTALVARRVTRQSRRMPSCPRGSLVVALACACGGSDDGREDGTATPTAPTGASLSSVGEASAAMTEATGTATLTEAGTTGVVGTTAAPDGTTTGGETSFESDSFPQTSIVSWDSSGFGETAEPECEHILYATVRDFQESHPDFELEDYSSDKGIVLTDLGADDKPVYAGQADNPTTSGQATFDQWYRDVAGVNAPFPLEIGLMDAGNGQYTYDNPAFFPIDNQGFGNEGNSHNYHFTLELHTVFVYKGGEVFKFRGDDDLFVFINKKLAIDLGGVHGPQEAEVQLDAAAGQLGILPGGMYQLDFFFAERHTSESNFRIETTIACLAPPG